ncbi:MAG: hypothetical protein V4559_10765 [Pseudomonadota bacterium]
MLNRSQRLEAVLAKRFPNNQIYPGHLLRLLTEYADSGLAPPHMIEEIETGEEGKLWSHLWEAMLYRHFTAQGYELRNRSGPGGQNGPDFRFDRDGKTIWVEAVVPSPEGIPEEYLTPVKPGEFKLGSKIDQPRVLRCTSAIADKKAKFQEYHTKGIVGPRDCAVIAVNICRLSDIDPDGNGISQYPLVMEALYPIGPIAVPINPDGTLGKAENMPRFELSKATGRTIGTGYFLDPAYSGIAAVIQGHQRDMLDRVFVLTTVHNPRATVPLPRGLFGAYREFVGEEKGDYCYVKDIAPKQS